MVLLALVGAAVFGVAAFFQQGLPKLGAKFSNVAKLLQDYPKLSSMGATVSCIVGLAGYAFLAGVLYRNMSNDASRIKAGAANKAPSEPDSGSSSSDSPFSSSSSNRASTSSSS